MVHFQRCSCRMSSNIAFALLAVLVIVVPIQGHPTTVAPQPHGLDPSFVKDPFYIPPVDPSHTHNSYPAPGAPSPANFPPGYHASAGAGSNPSSSQTTSPGSHHQNPPSPSQGGASNSQLHQLPNIYHYNSDPNHAPNPSQYPYNGHPPQAGSSHQYPYNSNYPTTTLSPVPPAVPAQSASGGEEYENEDGVKQGGAGTGGAGLYSQLSAHPPAQHSWYYGSSGVGSGSNSGQLGLLDFLEAYHQYQYQRRAQANVFNNPLFYLALTGW